MGRMGMVMGLVVTLALTGARGQPVGNSAFYGRLYNLMHPISGSVDYSVPPTNFVRAVDNPQAFTGNAADSTLIEDAIYDTNMAKFFALGSVISGTTGVGLYTATNPVYSGAWSYISNCVNGGGSTAPHLLQVSGTNYLYVDQETNIICYTSTSIYGPWTSKGEQIRTNAAWCSQRVKESWVMANAGATGYLMFHMGDSGSETEQVGYATASGPLGPWTEYTGNPLIPLGTTNTFDNRTVADPWVAVWNGIYYISYAAQTFTNHSGYTQIALASTPDLTNITRLGLLLSTNAALQSWDSTNVLRGGILKCSAPGFTNNRVWCMTYAGSDVAISHPKMGIANSPADTLAPTLARVTWLQTNATAGRLSYWTDINARGAAAYGASSGVYTATNPAVALSNFTHTVSITGLTNGQLVYAAGLATNVLSTAAASVETNFTVFAWPAMQGSNHYSTNNGSSSYTKTIAKLPSNTTAGNCVVVSIFLNSGSATSALTDTLGLTWTKATNCVYNAAGQQIMTYYATNVAAGLLRITNTTSSLSYSGMSAVEFSGVLAYQPVDVFATNSGTTSGGVMISVPVTTTAPGDLIYSAWGAPSTTWTAGSGYTIRETQLTCEDGVAAAAGVVSASAVPDGSQNYGVNVVAFKHQ